MRVMGVDPGTWRMGFGVVEEEEDALRCLEWGCLVAEKGELLHQRLQPVAAQMSDAFVVGTKDQLEGRDVDEEFASRPEHAEEGLEDGTIVLQVFQHVQGVDPAEALVGERLETLMGRDPLRRDLHLPAPPSRGAGRPKGSRTRR